METKETQAGPVAAPEPSAPPVPQKKAAPKLKAPKKRRKWIKRLIILIAVAVAAVLLFRPFLSAQTVSTSSYLPATAAYQDMTVSVSGTGTIQPIDSYNVTALVKGEILQAPFEEGDEVKKDDVLFRIDAKAVESNIQQQQLSLEEAKVNYQNLLKNQSDANQNQQIKANATGVVTELYVEQGDMVSAGAPIAGILDRDHMKLTVPFHSVDAAGFFLGQSAVITVDGTLESLPAVIDSIAATDSVGAGGTLVRDVTLLVDNPGALSEASTGTAAVGETVCASSASFAYGTQKQVVSKTSGELVSLSVKEGDRVTDGQIIGSFDETDMASQIETARLNIERAELSLQNARDSLEDYIITSPIDGSIIEMNYKAGDNVDPTSTSTSAKGYLAVIYDMSALEFQMQIDELDIHSIQAGQRVEITSDALDGKTFTGRVDKVNINGSTANGVTTYPVTIMVDDPKELLPGMNVSAKIIVEQIEHVLCVPVSAVSRGNLVTVADPGAMSEDGLSVADPSKLRQVEVVLGRNDDTYIEITSGLSEGDIVLIQNQTPGAMPERMGG